MQRTMKPRAIALAVSSLLALATSQVAMADSADDLLKKLKEKGILTEQEYDEFNNTRDSEKVKKNSEIKASFKDGISWESGDKQHSMGVTGRVQFDYRDVEGYASANEDSRDLDTASIADQFEIRRARIGVKGKFYNSYEYEVVTNLIGSNANLVDTAWANINWWEAVQFRFGRFKQPFSLEEQTSSNNIDFIERSYVNALIPGKKLGAMIHGEPMKGLNYGLSVYQDGFSELSSDTSEDKGMAGRVVTNIASFAGISDTVLHVGLAASDEKYAVTPTTSSQTSAAAPDDARGTIISFRSEGRGLGTVYRAQIAGTEPGTASYSQPSATTAEVQKRLRGLELAAAYGPFKLQGEYVKADFAARHLAAGSSVNGEVKAWYAEALWMLTGEKYSDFYKSGAFGAIKPKSDFIHPSIAMSANAWGAWELGFRMSRFDASDVTTTNGAVADAGTAREQGSDQVRSYTAGIKWIVNPNVKFVLNYVRTDFDTPFAPIDVTGGVAEDSEREISLRGQVTF